MASDYGWILKALVAAMKADTGLTALLGTFNGSQANSIFYDRPPKARAFPCISLMDIATGPGIPSQHDVPMAYVAMRLQVSVWGDSHDIRKVTAEVDELLETADRAGALNNTYWQFGDIDTSGIWATAQVPKEFLESTTPIEQRAKTFVVLAANKLI